MSSEQIAAKVEAFMRGEGLTDEPDKYDGSIHSWRCENPSRFGKCDCFQTFRDELTTLICELARAAAEACAQIAENAQEGWYYEAIESGDYGSGGESAARHIAEEIRATYRLEQTDG